MQKSNLVSGIIFAVLAVAFLVGAVHYGIGSSTSDGVPGAGFFPFVLGLVVLLLAISLIVQTLLHKGEKVESAPLDEEQKSNLRVYFLTIGALLCLFAIWRFVNFEVAAFLFCLAANRIYKRSWLFTIAYSVIVVTVIHLLFVKVLYISFEI